MVEPETVPVLEVPPQEEPSLLQIMPALASSFISFLSLVNFAFFKRTYETTWLIKFFLIKHIYHVIYLLHILLKKETFVLK